MKYDLRRYRRETTGPGTINYNRSKIAAHLLIVLKKCIYQSKTEGYLHDYPITIQQHITDQI